MTSFSESSNSAGRVTDRFRALHREGIFVMPNPFDLGSTRLFTALGFPALATTSAGFAATLGRLDMTVTREELVTHVTAMTAATDLPFNVDSERCFAEDPTGVAETVTLLGEAGAAGCSIEDWDPVMGRIDPVDVAAERVAAAAGAAAAGLVLTARCENHLHGVHDLDDTIARLCAYRDAGAEVVYAPGLADLAQVGRVVAETATPVNVLLLPGGPSVAQLGAVGVRRVSIGSFFTSIAHGAAVAAAEELLATGTISPTRPFLDRQLAARALGG